MTARALIWSLVAVAALAAVGAGLGNLLSDGDAGGDDPGGLVLNPEYEEPVTLSSEDGVLEVTLTARQGSASLNTVSEPAEDFLLFSYEVIRGSASNGELTGEDLYPSPTLQVDPGEELVVHFANELRGLDIRDFANPAVTPKGKKVPVEPERLREAPINLHTHGLHVSPQGNSDNVLLHLPAGYTNTYTYEIPEDHPEGMYWYHAHLHRLTAASTYRGLAGMLVIGRADGNIPLVSENEIPIRNMALQNNYVFDRGGGLNELRDPNWPQQVFAREKPTREQLAEGAYRPSFTPVNFSSAAEGTTYITEGIPSEATSRLADLQFIPGNLLSFEGDDDPDLDVERDLDLPDHLRDVQYTVNGQFQPALRMKPGQTEIWNLANISSHSYLYLTLTETATGRQPPFAIVAQDGNPSPNVHRPVDSAPNRLVIPPAARVAVAVTMPEAGDLLLEMPPGDDVDAKQEEGIIYTNTGAADFPAAFGTVTAERDVISYFDGFFSLPTQVLARVKPQEGGGVTTEFADGQPTDAFTSFVDTRGLKPDVRRKFVVTAGTTNNHTNNSDPRALLYSFNGRAFPNTQLVQPRLNSLEAWKFVNLNNDSHPIHVHVNDFQVSRLDDTESGESSGFQDFGIDVANLPVPKESASGTVTRPSILTLRTKFKQFTGTYVSHCHRLEHEDQGMMMIINVIPEVSTYAVAGVEGDPARVRVYDADGDRQLAELSPFPGADGTPSVAMADVDGDTVLDLVAGAPAGAPPELVVLSGAAEGGRPFVTELARFEAFEPEFRGGVNVAAAVIDGNDSSANIIAGQGPGGSNVKVFDAALPEEIGEAPSAFSVLAPFPGSEAGVSVAAGLIDVNSGRNSLVVAPGPGEPAQIRTYRFDLFEPNDPNGLGDKGLDLGQGFCKVFDGDAPVTTSKFFPFGRDYRGGISLATGWVAGVEGGVQRIIAGQLDGDGRVKMLAEESALQGESATYTQNPNEHRASLDFQTMASFLPFGKGSGGVRVAATSTTDGAHLLASGLADDSAELQKLKLFRNSTKAKRLRAKTLSRIDLGGGDTAQVGGA